VIRGRNLVRSNRCRHTSRSVGVAIVVVSVVLAVGAIGAQPTSETPADDGNGELRLHGLAVAGVFLLAVLGGITWHRWRARREVELERRRSATELQRTRERSRLLFERNLAGIFETDLEGRIIRCNRAFAEMLGFDQPDELEERFLSELAAYPDEVRDMLTMLQGGTEIASHQLGLRNRQCDTIAVLVNAGVIRDESPSGEIVQAIAIDISDRHRAEEDRRRSESQTQQDQKLESLGILAGGIAHDFNNMLMAILSNISLAKRAATDSSEAVRRLDDAEEACLRATGLTQQLLTFSRGGRPIRQTAPIGELVEESTASAARGGNCHYDCRTNPELWPVDADHGQVAQVVQNLVTNAIEAMPHGGTVTVAVDNAHLVEGDVPALDAGRFVRIDVLDTGSGIPDRLIGRIFDPFFTTKDGSSGLGLATAFSIVRGHGGAIVVHSEAEQGSKFTVYLPASDDGPAATPADDGQLRGHGRLLVMDDDEAVRSAAAELLESVGYEVATAADGAEAIDLYAAALDGGNSFDAVVLDLTVPKGVGGRETMARLLEIDPEVKAIVSSGYSTDPVMANYREHGFSGVAVKPYRLAELVQTLRFLIARPPER
jgi:PAS domain S-box-containing protein